MRCERPQREWGGMIIFSLLSGLSDKESETESMHLIIVWCKFPSLLNL